MKAGVHIRVSVIRALVRIAENGQRSQEELNQIFRGDIPKKDRHLVTELLYGSIRYAPFFLREINDRLKNGVAGTDPKLVWTLVLALYQLRVLDRVPEHAAVSTSVDAAKKFAGVGGARLVNGVLRAMIRAGFRDIDIDRCYPGYIRGSFRSLGVEEREASLSFLGHAPYALRGLGSWLHRPEDIVSYLHENGVESAKQGRVPGSVLIPSGGHLLRALLDKGGDDVPAMIPQDEASQAVAQATVAFLDPTVERGRVLDACAGRGVKTEYLASSLGSNVELLATDISESKLKKATRLTPGLRFQRHNWKTGPLSDEEPFDLVLVDAPCSGLGTLRRRPEIRLLSRRPEIDSLLEAQRLILQNTAQMVRPGGLLVYVICSFTLEEGQEP